MNKNSQQRISGMPCPNCQSFIPISMYQLLESKSIFCPSCGLKLNIDNKSSDKAKKILEKINAKS